MLKKLHKTIVKVGENDLVFLKHLHLQSMSR